MAKLIANRYARSLFEVGEELDKIENFYNELEILEKIFREEIDLMNFLNHPNIKVPEKKKVVSNIFNGKIEKELMNFLYILIDKKRQNNIGHIINRYNELYSEHRNRKNVVAYTVTPMSEKELDRMKSILSSKYEKEIILSNEIDKTLIGGVLLKIDDKIIDGSIRGDIEKIGSKMKRATI